MQPSSRSIATASIDVLRPIIQRVVVIEECAPNGSFAMQVQQLAWQIRATCRLDTFTLQDAFIHCYGSHEDLLAAHGLSVPIICDRLGLN